MNTILPCSIRAFYGVLRFLLVLIITIGCAPRESKVPVKDEPVPTPAPRPNNYEGSLKLDFQAQPLPNEYFVQLKWNVTERPSAWTLQRLDEENKTLNVATLEGSETAFTDRQVNAGILYTYVLSAMDGAQYHKVSEGSIRIPKDLEVAAATAVNQSLSVQRLFLRAGSVLLTNGNDVTITADELISDDGTIGSFADGVTANQGTSGRNGGNIVIHARTGTGRVHLIARGENGGAGLPGEAGGVGGPGGDGRDGQCGNHYAQAYCEKKTHDLWDNLCNPWPRAGLKIPCEGMKSFYCASETEDGWRGQRGRHGTDGQSGLAGGDSARILVEVQDPTNIQFDAQVFPGRGGPGGAGGPGGPGGPGGKPGTRDWLSLCRVANPGPQGNPGAPGHSGPPGADGKALPICQKLGNAKIGDCETF